MRRAAALLVLLIMVRWGFAYGGPTVAASVGSPASPSAALFNSCIAHLDAQTDVGYARIAARCPELVQQLQSGDWAAWLPRTWREPNNDLSAEGLRSLQRLAGNEATLKQRTAPPQSIVLAQVLARLPRHAAERWSRWRQDMQSWLEPAADPDERGHTDFMARLRAGTAGLDVIAYAALAAALLAAALVLLRAWRSAPAGGRRRRRAAPASTVPTAASQQPLTAGERTREASVSSWLEQRPRELLREILTLLSLQKQLPPSEALTVTEVLHMTRLAAAEREHLANLARVAERLRFALRPPEHDLVAQSIAGAEELLQQLRQRAG